jgi:hypothetical protein
MYPKDRTLDLSLGEEEFLTVDIIWHACRCFYAILLWPISSIQEKLQTTIKPIVTRLWRDSQFCQFSAGRLQKLETELSHGHETFVSLAAVSNLCSFQILRLQRPVQRLLSSFEPQAWTSYCSRSGIWPFENAGFMTTTRTTRKRSLREAASLLVSFSVDIFLPTVEIDQGDASDTLERPSSFWSRTTWAHCLCAALQCRRSKACILVWSNCVSQ